MKKSSCIKVNTLPVSKKAYNSFVARIDDILRDDRDAAAKMRTALDRYLAGDDSAASSLPPTLRLAFDFLRHDIDTAISRSARARMRAQQRKAASEIMPESGESCSETSGRSSQPLTRQQRRALERASRRKEQRPGPTGACIEPESRRI